MAKNDSLSILDGEPRELLRALGLLARDEDLMTAAAKCGGVQLLDELSGARPLATTAAQGWKAYLDGARSSRAQHGEPELVALLMVRRALVIANRDRSAMRTALWEHRFNWRNTWREVNLVTGGRLYGHGLRRSRTRGDRHGAVAMTLALECWQVIEEADESLPDKKRRDWRGMRGSAQMFLARHDEVGREPLLRGAINDFGIAERCGDLTPQHFQMLAEAHTLLYSATKDDALLDEADAVFSRARSAAAESAEVIAQRGELLFVRGVRAQDLADGDDDGTDAGHEPSAMYSLGPERETALRGAATAFDSSALWYTLAISRLPVPAEKAEVFCVRRGQSLQRSAAARRRMAQSPGLADSARRRFDTSSEHRLEAALTDLGRVEGERAKIRSDYWPRALCAKARRLIRSSVPEALDEAAVLVRRAREYSLEYVDPDHAVQQRTTVLGHEVDLRRCIRDGDIGGLRRALQDSDVIVAVPITPLIYAARLLCSAAESLKDDDRDLVEQVVSRLESAVAQTHGGQRAFAASHAATLLHLLNGPEATHDADASALERTYAMFKLADDEASSTRSSYHAARAASRLARHIARSGTVEMHARAVELMGASITALRVIAVDLEISQHERAGASADADDWLTIGTEADDISAASMHLEPHVVASLLGDNHLRREALRPSRDDLDEAITWLERSIALGNDSAACKGVLGDAYIRHGKRRRDPNALRRGMDLKTAAREQLEDEQAAVARENFSASAGAGALVWRITGEPASYATAIELAIRAEAADPTWPWPLLQLAELADVDRHVREGLPEDPPETAASSGEHARRWWDLVRGGRGDELRTLACQRAVANKEFMPTVLGGRSETYVLEDPHGLLSATLVLKPLDDMAQGRHERRRLIDLGAYLAQTAAPRWATVPEPIALLDADADAGRSAVFVTRRATGRPLSDVIADAVADGSSVRHHPRAEQALRRATTMLAMIHAAGPSADGSGHTKRRTREAMEKRLSRELFILGADTPKAMARQWMSLLPDSMTLVTKRDAHTENWLISESGTVVALDLQAASHLPVGFELAQLIEDMPALPAHDLKSRTDLAAEYLHELGARRPDLAEVLPAADDAHWRSAYACYAARRAIFTLAHSRRKSVESSGSQRLLEARRDHARALLRQTRAIVPGLVVFEPLLVPPVRG
ncbi:hypothetical protein FHT40_006319 [Mycolicibacterium sp. BK556]|uniref:hypothetical protein n=1 Tax=unclassified Mycolicibacterium TaxID=2636767 RepID=UPI00161A2839|nr:MULTISPECIES: hypothetical protein [unclassified Mycolicibacterium]MBB3606628.1 hypothetical protein [Mycolicibacterium sp. BK556]MBB3636125.1 hypothetical protein [Mycolicibacterium sp. BK607]